MVEISNKKIAQGIGWTTVSTIVNGLTQILRLSILARFLDKSDFGIVAILTFILGLTQVFSDLGFSAAIMSEKKLSANRFLNLFWLQLITYVSLMFVMSLASPLIADYYNDDALILLVPIMLSEHLFVGIGKLYDTVLQKNIQFKTIAIRNICASVISLLFAVVLAIIGLGVYSLVISTVLNAIIVNIWNFIAGQKTYKLHIVRVDFKGTKDLIKVGIYQMGTQMLDYLSSKLDIILISSFLGVSDLGIYNLAKEIVLKFVLIINSIVNKVMLPVLSYNSDNITNLRNAFFAFIDNITIINAPIVGFVFLFSPEIVRLFYGSGYEEADSIVRILSIWSLFVVLGQPNGLIAITIKRTDLTFIYTIIRLAFMSVFLYLFARYSLVSAALTMLTTYLCMFFVSWFMLLKRTVNIKLFDYLWSFLKTCISVSVVVFITKYICSFFNNEDIVVYYEMFFYWTLIVLYVIIFERRVSTLLITLIKRKSI